VRARHSRTSGGASGGHATATEVIFRIACTSRVPAADGADDLPVRAPFPAAATLAKSAAVTAAIKSAFLIFVLHSYVGNHSTAYARRRSS
jgi:hypothetical protein